MATVRRGVLYPRRRTRRRVATARVLLGVGVAIMVMSAGVLAVVAVLAAVVA